VSARIVRAASLPECALCERPVKRAVHERNGGLCNECDSGFRRVTGMLPPLVEK
jgi:hypothetical protein